MARRIEGAAAAPDRRHGASRDQLIEATAALLSERSSLDVSLSDIARRSGLNSALIKYYFGNKRGLLLALLERDAAAAMASLRHLVAMPLGAEQKLRIHVSGVINTFFRSPYLNRLIHLMMEDSDAEAGARVEEVFVRPMLAAYGMILEEGVAQGVFRPVDPAMLYYSLVGACDHIFLSSLSVPGAAGGRRMTDDLRQRYIAHVTDLFLRGLAR